MYKEKSKKKRKLRNPYMRKKSVFSAYLTAFCFHNSNKYHVTIVMLYRLVKKFNRD